MLHIHERVLHAHMCMYVCYIYTKGHIDNFLSSMIFFLPQQNEENVALQQVHIPAAYSILPVGETVGPTNAGVLQRSLFIWFSCSINRSQLYESIMSSLNL